MIKEIILKELSKRIIDSVVKAAKNTKIKTYSTEADIFDALSQHLVFVNQWSSEVNFADLKQAKSTNKVFVQLDLYFQPQRIRLTENDHLEKFELAKIFQITSSHIALLGQVGSGKTTSLKYLCQSLLFNIGLFPSEFFYPLVIKLNEYNISTKEQEYSKNILFNSLIKILGLKFNFQSADEKTIEIFKEWVVIDFLNNRKILLLIDGFDELIFKTRRDVVINEFEKLISNVSLSRIIMTSRSSDFKYSFSKLAVYEICPLNDEQILTFASRWLEDIIQAQDFVSKIKKSPFYDTAVRPLTIAHLCAIYERNKSIPEKPKTVYKKIVMLLLEEWNLQRNIQRISKYSKFENDRKFEFLSTLAYRLTVSNNSTNFNSTNLRSIYQKIHQDFDLEESEMESVVSELESHSGLILQSGFQRYEFAHKSIQEYLTAEYIVKLPVIPTWRNTITRLPNEFAVAIAISSRPSEYFFEFVVNRLSSLRIGPQFVKPFISRLLLEKIDFNKSLQVASAALLLYSIYIKGAKAEGQQILLFYFDDLILEFENFINEIFKRNDKNSFFANYDVQEELPSADGQAICKLVLKDKTAQYLPDVLYTRSAFLN